MSNRTARRLSAGLASTALVALSLPLAAAPGQAAPPVATAAAVALAAPSFGYSTAAWGTPVHVEIYEPTIPLPASPQAELENGYTEVLADSSSSQGRSSYLWPGDPVGEGFKTIAEQLGLPDEIGSKGYPFQVNAAYPSGPESQADEPAPTMIQRASAGEGTARAVNGFSGDGEAQEPGEGGGGTPAPPGVPGLPGLPAVPGLPTPGASGGLGGFGQGVAAEDDDAPAAAPTLPPELTALVDVGSFSSVSTTDNRTRATAASRAAVGDVSVLGGMLTVSSIDSAASATSDGTRGVPAGRARFGDLQAFGQDLVLTRTGLEAAGQGAPIPGLPDDAAAALAALGVKVTAPKPERVVEGDAATTTVPGLVIEFDLTKLRTMLQDVPINDLVNQVPDEAGELKSLLQAAANLSPRIVVTLGQASASVDTSPPLDIPQVPLPEAPEAGAPAGAGGSASAGGSGGSPQAATPPGATAPGSSAPGGSGAAQDAAGTLFPTSGPEAPGLPKLFSIPGMLLLGALLLAALGGNVMRRLGVAALGGGAACSHGLDSGLPDLRKVN